MRCTSGKSCQDWTTGHTLQLIQQTNEHLRGHVRTRVFAVVEDVGPFFHVAYIAQAHNMLKIYVWQIVGGSALAGDFGQRAGAAEKSPRCMHLRST